MKITPDQIRAARALLKWNQGDLAEQTGTSQGFISWVENLDGTEPVERPTLDEVRQVLERAGVEFIPGGVRRRSLRPDAQERFERIMAISRASAAALKGRDDLLTDDDLYDENGLPA